jgi:PEGA domain-containing protein
MMVESKPSNASVRVDGRVVGKTPLKLPSVATGDHSVVIEHEGYRRWASSVRIVAGRPSRVTASLER